MTEPLQSRVIADTGDLVVAERGPLVIVVDRATGPLATTAFVVTVLAVVFGGFGAVMLAIGRSDVPAGVSAAFLAVGIALAAVAYTVVRRIRAGRRRALETFRPVAVFDRARGVFTDADGVVLAPLSQVRFDRRMQVGSSSPKLVAITPTGERLLKRGNPFNGGIGNLDAVLTAAVHGH